MASTKISALTTDSSPHRTNDFAPTYDASASGNKKVALKDFGVICLIGGFANFSPADATTYYFGAWLMDVATTGATNGQIYMPRAGIITRADVYMLAGVLGTAETSTMSIRLNNTTDTTISAAIALAGSPFHVVNSSLGISVATTDYINIKWATPTWVTNPTNVYCRVTITLE